MYPPILRPLKNNDWPFTGLLAFYCAFMSLPLLLQEIPSIIYNFQFLFMIILFLAGPFFFVKLSKPFSLLSRSNTLLVPQSPLLITIATLLLLSLLSGAITWNPTLPLLSAAVVNVGVWFWLTLFLLVTLFGPADIVRLRDSIAAQLTIFTLVGLALYLLLLPRTKAFSPSLPSAAWLGLSFLVLSTNRSKKEQWLFAALGSALVLASGSTLAIIGLAIGAMYWAFFQWLFIALVSVVLLVLGSSSLLACLAFGAYGSLFIGIRKATPSLRRWLRLGSLISLPFIYLGSLIAFFHTQALPTFIARWLCIKRLLQEKPWYYWISEFDWDKLSPLFDPQEPLLLSMLSKYVPLRVCWTGLMEQPWYHWFIGNGWLKIGTLFEQQKSTLLKLQVPHVNGKLSLWDGLIVKEGSSMNQILDATYAVGIGGGIAMFVFAMAPYLLYLMSDQKQKNPYAEGIAYTASIISILMTHGWLMFMPLMPIWVIALHTTWPVGRLRAVPIWTLLCLCIISLLVLMYPVMRQLQ